MADLNAGSLASLYHIEQLKEDNWFSWKMKIEAILDDRGLEGYTDGTKVKPADNSPLQAEKDKWNAEDKKARTIIKLLIHDSQSFLCAGAKTAFDLWEQLKSVKEPRGKAGILTWRKKLYGTRAKDSSDIPSHLKTMRETFETLRIMGDTMDDEAFKNTLMASLPQDWDQFLIIYTQSGGAASNVNSHELYAILMEEVRRRKEALDNRDDEPKGKKRKEKSEDESQDTALVTYPNKRKFADRIGPKKCGICKKPGHQENQCWHKGKTCYNCNKPGHVKDDCWQPGGGKAGQGPSPQFRNFPNNNMKDIANVATTSRITELPDDDPMDDVAFMAQDDDLEFVNSEQSEHRLIWYDWLADSGTTSHITNMRNAITDYVPLKARQVNGIGNESLVVAGRGMVEIESFIGKTKISFKLKDVLYVPNATHNLISISRLDQEGGHAEIKNGTLNMYSKGGKQLARATLKKGLYALNARAKLYPLANINIARVQTEPNQWEDWHKRLGHISYAGLKQLYQQGLVDGMIVDENSPTPDCEACIQAKHTRNPFPKMEIPNRAETPGTLTHSDVWGPARTESIGGSKYYISFTDDCTRRCTVEFMKLKSQASEKVKQYLIHLQNRCGKTPKIIRVDNGTEYINADLMKWCKDRGIEVQQTAPYSPEQNGLAERLNRTLIELARAMLIAKKLPEMLWAEAVSHAAYLRNRASTRALQGATPEGLWNQYKPNIEHLQEFGTSVYVLLESTTRSKLMAKSEKHIFVGFADGPKAIKYYNARTRQVKITRNFRFLKNTSVLQREGENGSEDTQAPTETVNTQQSEAEAVPTQSEVKERGSSNKRSCPDENEDMHRRSKRQTVRHDYQKLHDPEPDWAYLDYENGYSKEELTEVEEFLSTIPGMNDQDANEPKTLREAQESSEWPKWEEAIKAELTQLKDMGTWELVDRPKERTLVGNKWVFVKKTNKEGEVIKYKARLVAKGYSQKPGMEYNKTFSPVVRLETIRSVMSTAALLDWEIQQMDVKGAYLNGIIKEEVYMTQPEGFDDGTGRVCRLKKTLYGLKQSGREWNIELNTRLTDIGFRPLRSDPCAYIRKTTDGIEIITVWVDDLLLFANTLKLMDGLKEQLKSKFDITDLGEPKKIVGIEVTRNRPERTIHICQTKFIENILTNERMQSCNPVGMPMDPGVVLKKNEEDRDDELQKRYASLIGSLMYLAVATRPDIAYAIHRLGSYTANPSKEHMGAAKRVLRYLAGTRNIGITYKRHDKSETRFYGWMDADFANDPNDRLSISGYVFKLGEGPISWSSKKQHAVALSTTEAEYTAMAHAAREAIWLRNLFGELYLPQRLPTILYGDNQSALAIARDPQYHARSKHFDVKSHFIRDKIRDGTVKDVYCPTDDMVADILTKPLHKPKHTRFTFELGMSSA